MKKINYALYDGSVYRKPDESKYSYYVHCSDVHHNLGNAEVADDIVSHVSPIISLLSVKSCRLIEPMKVDYNFIEVLPFGTCFSIRGKCFELDPTNL